SGCEKSAGSSDSCWLSLANMLLKSNNPTAVWGRFVMPPAAHNLRRGERIREHDHSTSHVPWMLGIVPYLTKTPMND
ncbi:MAG: hypothetical protein WAK55_15760, partial [Xanthobacteraceae bacterium]